MNEAQAETALLGTWHLGEWVARADGCVEHPFTEQASGRLIYAADGLMAAFLQAPGWSACDADFVPQRSRFIAYSGGFRIDGDAVLHQVDAASDPRWIGSELVRYFTIAGNMLTIETRPTSRFGIGKFNHRLKWSRVEDRPI